MIELIFSLLLSSPDTDKKYEYCHRPNRCQMVNAVQYNVVLIRNQIQKFKPVLPAGLICMVNLKLSPDGGITSISALNCDPQYSAMIIKGIVSASPFEMIPEAYSHVYDINLTISQ